MENTKISQELKNIKKAFDTPIQILPGLYFNQQETVKMAEYYQNSRYLNGQLDEKGREKPFYNILNAIVDVENAAKDIDTKDIVVTSDDGNHYTEAFLLSKDIGEWMKEEDFAKTLNEIIDTHTKYGGVIVKKCEYKDKDGKNKLELEIPAWKNVTNDQVQICEGPIIETHYMTIGELKEKEEYGWSKEKIDELIKEYSKGQSVSISIFRIPVHEIRAELPNEYYNEVTGEELEEGYSYQLHYVGGNLNGNLTVLYSQIEEDETYKYCGRKVRSGRGLGVGVYEEGEQAQVWTNDTILKQARAMEYTTKAIGQTASKKLKGKNLLSEVEDGQILLHDGNPITRVDLSPSGGLAQFENLKQQWYSQLERASSAYSAQRGETPPSGQPFRLQALVLQQSGGVFDDLKEDLGIFITEIFEDWIMPFIAKNRLNKDHILSHNFSLEELSEIDKNFSTYQANEMIKRKILDGEIVNPEDFDKYKNQALDFIRQTKSHRFLNIPKDYYKNIKFKVSINVTGENKNKGVMLESLINIMNVYAQNPNVAQDPVLSQIFMRIAEISGVGLSPVSLMAAMNSNSQNKVQQLNTEASKGLPEANLDQLSLESNPLKEVTNV